MPTENQFQNVFDDLKGILKEYEKYFNVKTDTSETYYLEGSYIQQYKQNLFFGSAQVKKNYVSYYLMPVYMFPDLLEGITPELKKRMQGKSCFNFKRVDPKMFSELSALTEKSFQRLQKENLVR